MRDFRMQLKKTPEGEVCQACDGDKCIDCPNCGGCGMEDDGTMCTECLGRGTCDCGACSHE